MNLLAVDDEALALGALEVAIREALPNCTPACFRSPAKALKYVQEHPIDVGFLDVDMPGMTGIALAKAIKDIRPDINIIFVTGYDKYAGDAFELHASGYLLKPVEPKLIVKELQDLRHPVAPSAGFYIRIQCFGNFELFVNGKPVHFAREKSKEALAYLVDRQGASVTTAELSAILWEDRKYSRSYVSVILSDLIKNLNEVGADKMIIRRWNHIAVDTSQFWCDSYAFAKGDVAAVNAYFGEYMAQYSWAERFNAGFWHMNI